MALTKLNYTGQGTIPSANMPAGSVLQTKQVIKKDRFAVSGLTFTNITGLVGINITPSSTSNKILITVSGTCSASSNSRVYFKITGTTSTVIGDADTGHEVTQAATTHSGDGYMLIPISMNFLDAPNSVSQQTYGLQMMANGSGRLNAADTIDANTGNTITTITLQEIKG
jgi:hypothetical protein